MHFATYLFLFLLLGVREFSRAIKFSAESFAEISLLAKKGRTHLESLKEKANVPQFGPCWRNAISDLQIGCKFLSENVQSDIALRFTDCFLQMSGHEPLTCDLPKSACLKKLSDRAFNAYTEFYTHTQSICYYLQSQIWHEETEKTIDKLSLTSIKVSQKLEEAGEIQEKLLSQQKESLLLQHDLNNSSQNVASVLQLSQDKINVFMKDFKVTAAEQKELLLDLFENLVLFRSWAVNELSWFSSTVYFAAVTLITFLFTSVSRTREARMVLFIIFAFNYIFERLLMSSSIKSVLMGETASPESLNSWIWLCRKFCICLGVIILLYTAFSYYDYNIRNYQLLLEIKKQNLLILNHFAKQTANPYIIPENNSGINSKSFNDFYNSPKSLHKDLRVLNTSHDNYLRLSQLNSNSKRFSSYSFHKDVVDSKKDESPDKVSVTNEKENTLREPKTYNLRSHKSTGKSILKI